MGSKNGGYWYCPVYCFTRQAYRLFRADRMMTVSINDNVSYLEDVNSKTVFNWDVEELEGQEQTLFCAYLTQKGKRKLEENGRFKDFIESLDDGGGVIRMYIPANKLEFYTDMIWELGQEAKITEPMESIIYIKCKLEEMKKLYP
ncbi:WYL domain-containing protein [Paenibacillus sp. MDMC362]|uniref:WYL domain-containing protein n=1 Tax=Paenibacillus sp. MDMC362 TaxID=2977365 RepID=UPI000DC5A3E0|nr:WYL domain-containing protein [Paenibacillus sp. MDMC362]RAR42213.1 hypothetical protein DP091_19520 [Paenibacillus sp. MDMC362]